MNPINLSHFSARGGSGSSSSTGGRHAQPFCGKSLRWLWMSATVAFSPWLAQGADVLPATQPLPDLGFSLVRLGGALLLVLGLFLGGVWLFRNWQRLAVYKGRTPKLNILEVKSLGSRHALYLVSYEQQRLLISSSPAGINLLTHLPEADAAEPVPAGTPAPASFAENLRRVLAAKS